MLDGIRKAFLGPPLWVTLIGFGAMFVLFTPLKYGWYWQEDPASAAIQLLLLIELWLLSYLLVPIAFILTDVVPWNRKRAGTLQGENDISIAAGIVAMAMVPGSFVFLGDILPDGALDFATRALLAVGIGAVGPVIFFFIIVIYCIFPSEG